jgi:hypothetical protein
MSEKRARERDARLVYLGRAVRCLDLPILVAEGWICPEDLTEFIREIDQRIRALLAVFDGYLEKHPGLLQQASDQEAALITEVELGDVRKKLGFLARIGKPAAKKDRGKSNPTIVKEAIRNGIVGSGRADSAAEEIAGSNSAPDFSAEIEELRRLRSGELNDPPKGSHP